jgi:hypothetical protein
VTAPPAPVTSLQGREDLKPRNLLDDPALRRAVGLDPHGTEMPKVAPTPVPELRFDRRRLLAAAAA